MRITSWKECEQAALEEARISSTVRSAQESTENKIATLRKKLTAGIDKDVKRQTVLREAIQSFIQSSLSDTQPTMACPHFTYKRSVAGTGSLALSRGKDWTKPLTAIKAEEYKLRLKEFKVFLKGWLQTKGLGLGTIVTMIGSILENWAKQKSDLTPCLRTKVELDKTNLKKLPAAQLRKFGLKINHTVSYQWTLNKTPVQNPERLAA